MATSTIKKPTIFVNAELNYNADKGLFPVIIEPKTYKQITMAVRNTSTGSIYIVWYDQTVNAFRIASVVSGSQPTQGQAIACVYEI